MASSQTTKNNGNSMRRELFLHENECLETSPPNPTQKFGLPTIKSPGEKCSGTIHLGFAINSSLQTFIFVHFESSGQKSADSRPMARGSVPSSYPFLAAFIPSLMKLSQLPSELAVAHGKILRLCHVPLSSLEPHSLYDGFEFCIA